MNNDKNLDKTITFLMPGSGKAPSGGYKVIYEQANRLVKDGWSVFILYPIYHLIKRPSLRNIAGVIKRYCQGFIGRDYQPNKWFNCDSRIIHRKVFSLCQNYVPETQFYCATTVETAFYLNDYLIDSHRKIYYIQGFETWHVPEAMVLQSYSFAMTKVTIATWLQAKVSLTGNEAILIPNGFDFDNFYIELEPDARDSYTGMMLYSAADDIKRCSDTIAAFKKVKAELPLLKVLVFGVPSRPADLPEWFEYYRTPSKNMLRKLYNTAAVFVAASRTEGMALPPAEALLCGCALVCTDIGGFKMYAIDNETALMSPVFDIDALAHNIFCLMINTEKRIVLAKAGRELLQQYTWDNAYKLFCNVLES